MLNIKLANELQAGARLINFDLKWQKFPWHCRVSAGSGKSWKILELEKCPGKSWNALEYLDYFEEFWKSSGILQNVCPVDFLWQIIFMVRSHQIGCIIKQESIIVLFVHSFRLYKVREFNNCLYFPQMLTCIV